jgi:hypothetical protein
MVEIHFEELYERVVGLMTEESSEQMLINLSTKTNCKLDEQMLALTGMAEYLKAIALTNLEVLRSLMLIQNQLNVDKSQMYVTIPEAGGYFAVQPGATTIDFTRGEIINPDGTVNPMRTSLRVQDLGFMRSFMMTTAGDLNISIDGDGTFSLDAGEKFALGDYDFKEIYLGNNGTTNVNIKLMASTTPEMTVFYDKYFAAEMEKAIGNVLDDLYEVDATVQQQVFIDLGGTMSRIFVEAMGKSDASTTYTLETSEDNVHWFPVDEDEGMEYNFGGGNTFRYVRLTSAVAASGKISLVLKATR